MKREIRLSFMGFYESHWMYCDKLYWFEKEENQYLEEEGLDYRYGDDVEGGLPFNYEHYKKDVANFVTEKWMGIYRELFPFIKGYKNDSVEIDSPMYYNYTTDRIFVTVDLEDGWEEQLKSMILGNKELFQEFLIRYHTSRSGFVSFMENTVKDWIPNLDDELYLSYSLMYLAAILADEPYRWSADSHSGDVFSKLEDIEVRFNIDFEDSHSLGDYYGSQESGLKTRTEALPFVI